jgi:predicted O-linked N-acetylglucosamine transferase (SPINDLY family)
MITVTGETFASRVATSLLANVNLEPLIARSIAEYETLALELAHDPARREALRRHLRERRDTLPLFDSVRFTRGLEAAYGRMWQRLMEGKPAEAFAVNDR